MSTTARHLIDQALAADLTQNELKVFLALFRQTLCYGKRTDPLTLKRLVSLTGIRKDRIARAIEGVISKGLFERKDHPIFEVAYSIPVALMGETDSTFFAPHLLKKGTVVCEAEATSEKQNHTIIHLTACNPTSPPSNSKDRKLSEAESSGLHYPSQLNDAERQQATRLLDSLSPTAAQNCLDILKLALEAGRVKSALGYLHQLSQAARMGRLNCSLLKAQPTSTLTHLSAATSITNSDLPYRLRTLAGDIQALDRLYQLSGLVMDANTQAHRQTLVNEFNCLKVHIQEGA